MLKFANMRRVIILILFFLLSGMTLGPSRGSAFWVWTPETNKWVNPKYAIKDTPQEQLQFGMDFYNAKQYKEAVREFQKLIEHYPRAREAPDAQYHIGLCLEEQDNILGAFKQYQVVID